MFVSPSKIKQDKLLSGRTINFETVQKTYGNMVIIPTVNKEDEIAVINSNLFRPMQLMALYTPRRIKPVGKSMITVSQKDYYAEMREKTNGKIRKGKTMLQSYNGQNLIYDIYNNYMITKDALSMRRQKRMLQNELFSYFESLISEITQSTDYENAYLVFPLVRPFEDTNRIFVSNTDFETIDPLPLFVRALNHSTLNTSDFKKIKMVFFYDPNGDILLAVDIHRDDFDKIWPSVLQKLKRMNNHLAGNDSLSGDVETEDEGEEELSPEDKYENKKENIKNIVFSHVAKTLHASNLTDFEAASRDEKDLMVVIDKRVDDYLQKPENLQKSMGDLIADIETNNDIKAKAVRYIETKKAAVNKSNFAAKQMEKEADLIGSLQDLDEPDKTNDPSNFKIDMPFVDERIEKSHLTSIDEEYNKKQSMKDLTNVISAFSNNEYTPMIVDSISYEDSDNDVDEKRTLSVRYKTDDNKMASFQVDVPKIVDNRYLYLGGNKKVIKKQLIRLPIVKTKSDRVEITTNYQKMTIERTNGNLSRKNMYIFKKLKEIGDNPAFKIEYGDNSVANEKMGYVNNFEYEELASKINKITSVKYELFFNRDSCEEEVDVQDIPDGFTKDKTPLGFEKVGESYKKFIYIKDNKIYGYDLSTKTTELIENTIFDFLVNDVLKLDMSVLPSIGKSFIYTNVKFLQTTYPIFAVVGSQVGLSNVMQRYNIKYHISQKQEKKNIEYVEVKFKDCFLYYEDTVRNTLLLNALYLLNPEEYNYSDFDIDVPYTAYFIRTLGESVGIHTRNTLRINLSVMVDPITRDILLDLKQPTNIIDLMLYANTLLVGNQYKPGNDMTNWRIRSNELINDRLYGILADAYVSYCKHKINGKPVNLTIPKGILISKLQQEPNINDKSTLNPVIECEQIAQASAKRL